MGEGALLGLTVRRLRKIQRGAGFPEPVGENGGSFWRERDVFEWVARQGQPLAGRVSWKFRPTAQEQAVPRCSTHPAPLRA
jgi:hypothetical protein